MAQKTLSQRTPQAYLPKPKTGTSYPATSSAVNATPENPTPENPEPETAEDVVVFTSYDGTIREVGALPSPLGRATALASEKSVGKIWGTPEEEAACHAMREGM